MLILVNNIYTVVGGRGEVFSCPQFFSFTLRASKITWIDACIVRWIDRWLYNKLYSKMLIVTIYVVSMWVFITNSLNISVNLKNLHDKMLLSLFFPLIPSPILILSVCPTYSIIKMYLEPV